MNKPTPQQIAAIFGVPVENVKAQYAKNAEQLRKMAITGSQRGFTVAELRKLAAEAKDRSK